MTTQTFQAQDGRLLVEWPIGRDMDLPTVAVKRGEIHEVLISTHPPKQSNWLETGIVTRLRDELDIPITHLVIETAALR